MALRWLVWVLCLGVIGEVQGQKHDYQWLFGYGNSGAATDTDFGGVTMDFNHSPALISRHVRLADFDEDNISFCDNNGHLLFYSNGGDLFDSRDSIMLNGDSINFGDFWYSDLISTSDRFGGLPIVQGMIALPYPGDSDYAVLYHYPIRNANFPDGLQTEITDTFYYSSISLNENNGLGKVIRKNEKLCSDSLAYSQLSAVRHGNGRDWWIIHPYYKGNCYYTFLLTPHGTSLHEIQCIGGDQMGNSAISTSCFSPNGEKYFWVNSIDGIHMFDFDRCNGTLSNPQIIPFPFPHFGDSVTICSGIAVSPNNRYLYVLSSLFALQYDLQAADIVSSVDTVAIWDGTSYPSYPDQTAFFYAQMGPDGKIYINSPSGTKALSVINQPNFKGDSCMFSQHSIHLPTYNESSLPNFPNYRLGAQTGSACDTLSTATQDIRDAKEQILKVFPNPANDVTTIDYGFTDWNKGPVTLQITDGLGQVVYTQPLPMYSGFQRLDVSRFAAGLYNVAIKRSGATVAVSKLVKESLPVYGFEFTV